MGGEHFFDAQLKPTPLEQKTNSNQYGKALKGSRVQLHFIGWTLIKH